MRIETIRGTSNYVTVHTNTEKYLIILYLFSLWPMVDSKCQVDSLTLPFKWRAIESTIKTSERVFNAIEKINLII